MEWLQSPCKEKKGEMETSIKESWETRTGSSYAPWQQQNRIQEEDHSLQSWQGLFVARTQPRKNQGLFVNASPLNFLFLSIKAFSFSCPAHHGGRSRIEILCWSWINPSLLEKYPIVCFGSTPLWSTEVRVFLPTWEGKAQRRSASRGSWYLLQT